MKIVFNPKTHEPDYEPDDGTEDHPIDEAKGKLITGLKKFALTGADSVVSVAAKPISYLWGPIIVRGAVNLFASGPGTGKSSLLVYFYVARARAPGSEIKILGYPLEAAPVGTFQILIQEAPEESTARKLVRAANHL